MSTTQNQASTDARGARQPLRVLLVEDSEADANLLRRALERSGFEPRCQRVDTREAMELALRTESWDLILADHAMPQFSAPEALQVLKEGRLDVPFIIVSGHIEEETAIQAMKAGAHDFIMKDRLARLAPAVERELREAQVRCARQKSEEDLRRAHEELETRVVRAANLKLQNVIEERKRLENELLEIAEHERRRIGFDLHDDLGQKLTGVLFMLKGLEQRLAAEGHSCVGDARRIQEVVQDITRHTHDLARQFSSLGLRGNDLASVLQGLAGNVKKTFDIPCEFSVSGGVPDLPEDTTLQLYKIAQEAVSNAIKHGKATQVSICLAQSAVILVMSIENKGVPFASAASATHRMGLRIMNYRARTIGASLEIKPVSKSGTIVTCALPVEDGPKVSRRSVGSGELATGGG